LLPEMEEGHARARDEREGGNDHLVCLPLTRLGWVFVFTRVEGSNDKYSTEKVREKMRSKGKRGGRERANVKAVQPATDRAARRGAMTETRTVLLN
jgi:hypothetical protein